MSTKCSILPWTTHQIFVRGQRREAAHEFWSLPRKAGPIGHPEPAGEAKRGVAGDVARARRGVRGPCGAQRHARGDSDRRRRAFCAGADISEFAEVRSDVEAGARLRGSSEAATIAIRDFPRPTIAAMSGFGVGRRLRPRARLRLRGWGRHDADGHSRPPASASSTARSIAGSSTGRSASPAPSASCSPAASSASRTAPRMGLARHRRGRERAGRRAGARRRFRRQCATHPRRVRKPVLEALTGATRRLGRRRLRPLIDRAPGERATTARAAAHSSRSANPSSSDASWERSAMAWLGVDVGGTFTDLVLFDRGSRHAAAS